jgi:hypothetical protein
MTTGRLTAQPLPDAPTRHRELPRPTFAGHWGELVGLRSQWDMGQRWVRTTRRWSACRRCPSWMAVGETVVAADWGLTWKLTSKDPS